MSKRSKYLTVLAVASLAWFALYLLSEEIVLWHFSNAKLPSVLSEVKNFRRLHLLEERYAQTPKAGTFIKPFRGLTSEIDPAWLQLSFSDVFWCVPPPSGDELKIYNDDGSESAPPSRPLFYACTARPLAGKRLFFFHGSLRNGARCNWLPDDQVNWYFQTPLDFLDPDEREIEQNYRQQQNLKFPLGTLGSTP